MIRIGTAGWTVPAAVAADFPITGSGLARYAAVFSATEINSSFSRAHRRATYERWAGSVEPNFRFSVKVPRAISHDLRLAGVDDLIDAFLAQVAGLGSRQGPLLLQLPPSLEFASETAAAACRRLAGDGERDLVCEPRHASWFTPAADEALAAWRLARVAADPARHAGGGDPGGWRDLAYYRLHGSPQVYRSAYGPAGVDALLSRIKAHQAPCAWCVFDNTASGAAAADALLLRAALGEPAPDSPAGQRRVKT